MSGAAALPLAVEEELSTAEDSVEEEASPELPPIACRWMTPPLLLLLLACVLPLEAGAADRASGMARPAAVAVRLGAGAGCEAGAGAAAIR